MKRSIFIIFAVSAISVSVFAKKKFMITTTGETLRALTQITDSKYACITPFGGDYGKDLYYAVNEDGKYYNIFKKENVGASATQQKTAGKNFNYSPSYCAETDKVAFRCMNEGMSQSDIYIFSNNKGKALTQVTETNQAYEGNPCISQDGKMLVYDRQSYVTFKQLSDEEIDYYITNYRPFDKAGAYGIQEWIGNIGVTGLNGSYFNVMGLPVQRIYNELRKF